AEPPTPARSAGSARAAGSSGESGAGAVPRTADKFLEKFFAPLTLHHLSSALSRLSHRWPGMLSGGRGRTPSRSVSCVRRVCKQRAAQPLRRGAAPRSGHRAGRAGPGRPGGPALAHVAHFGETAMSHPSRRSRRGFTLIELLVVIAIIAVLI